MMPLRHLATWLGLPARRERARVAVVEECEQRILYSADLNPALWVGSGDVAASSAIVRTLDAQAAPAALAPSADVQTPQQQRQHEIVFVDAGVADSQKLIDGLLAGRPAGTQFEVVMLQAGTDGLSQIGKVLATEQDIAALHIISHGRAGELQLGNTTVGASVLQQRGDELQAWRSALTAGADILLYGCDVAASADGQQFVGLLARLTGADVAASTDATANAAQGGNWALEYQSGQVETSSLVGQHVPSWDGVLAITSNGSNSSASTTGATSLTWAHTVDSGSNRVLFVELSIDNLGASVSSVTYGGVALTQVGRTGGNHAVEIWSLVNPTVGTANVVASFGSATTAVAGGATTFNGVDQTSPTGTYVGAAGTGVVSSVVVSSAAGDLVIDAQHWDNSPAGYSVGAGQTLQWTAQATGAQLGVSTTEAGAASVTMGGTVSASSQWAIGAVSIHAAANEGPVNTVPGAQSTNEDTALVFSTANGNTISISDAAAGGADNEITLSVSNGTLTLAGTTGLTFTAGDGTADATMTLRGTASAINAALNGLSYSPTANFNGSATLTLATKGSTLLSLNIDASLVGHYTFDNTGSLGGDDSPAGANDGTVSGAIAANDATRGNVLNFDGVDDYVQVSGRMGSPANVTLAAWVNLDAGAGAGELISIGDSVAIRLDEAASSLGINAFFYNGSTWVTLSSGTFIAGTGWHHIAYVFNDTGNTHTLYIDGVAAVTAATAQSISYSQGLDTFIGRYGNGSNTYLAGKVDEARIYNRALAAGEIASLFVDQSLTDTDTVAITVSAVNDAPSGAPVVAGTPAEDQTLTANTGAIADADGLGSFSYQWQRDGVDIGGATGSTYALGDADVGALIRVVVSYTDGNGTAESLTSAAVGPVVNVNDVPSGAPIATGSTTEDQTLTADTSTIADADGLGAFNYQWQRNGVDIAGATGSTYTLGDVDVATNIRVLVAYTDGHGSAENLTSAAVGPVANVNDVPTGAPVVTGTPTEDQTLTANTGTIADADGLGTFNYQWQRDGVDIAGATGSTHMLGDADVGALIRVVVSYTDGNGAAESLTSAAVGPVANVNDAATGSVTITGTATQGQTLTASNNIADVDGLGTITYHWLRDGVDTGSTGATYLLGEADVGSVIAAEATYTDGHGTAETVTSTDTAAVANVNDAATGSVTVAGTATQGQTLTASDTIADVDGLGTITYHWLRDGVDTGSTGTTYLLGEADVGSVIAAEATYTDGHGTAEAVTSAATAAVGNVNDVPTGAPVVTGTATEDQTLTANTGTIADADGLGTFNYQWQRNGVDIAGATGSTYTLGDVDVATNIRVLVAYTDGNGSAENLTSAAVGPVANVNDVPTGAPVVTGTPTEDQTLTANTGAIADADGLGAFNYQWQRNGVDIAGATGSTHTLGDADVGTAIRVVVSYTDSNGAAESLTSAAIGLITNVNDAPRIISNGGGSTASLSGNENQFAVTTVNSVDIDGATPSYSITGGADAARFMIDSATGALSFVAAPDFEAPADANADNIYDVTVQVSDGVATDSQVITITIVNVNEAPTALVPAVAQVSEQAPAGTLVATVTASDPDAGELFSFSLVSDAGGRFAIDASSGRITVAPGAELNFETQPSIDLLVRVTDAGGLSIDRTLTVALLDQVESNGAAAPTAALPTAPSDKLAFDPVSTASSPSEQQQVVAALPPAIRAAGAGRSAPPTGSLDGDLVRVSAETGRAGAEVRASMNPARPWAHLRERDGADALVVTANMEALDLTGNASTLLSTVLRQMTQALRNAAIEADPADLSDDGEQRAPSTLTEILQDPVRLASVGVTAGFVWWLTRSGGLLTSMLMGAPAWRHLDLLPVVARHRDDEDEGDDDSADSSNAADDLDDSALLDLFEAQPAPPQARSRM